MASESQVQYAIMVAFGSRPGLRIWRTNTGALFDARGHLVRYGIPGGPDITGIMAPNGRYLGIECKSDSGTQTTEQIAFQKMVESLGGLYILARSIEDVESALQRQK